MFAALFIAIVIFWLCSAYIGLIIKKQNVLKAFSALDAQLKRRYDLISDILTGARNYSEAKILHTEETAKFLMRLMNLPSGIKNIDRKIALNLMVTQDVRQIIAVIGSSSQFQQDSAMNAAIQAYKEFERELTRSQIIYNSAAKKLKTAVEVFPSSFFARLANIKAVDFFKPEKKI